MQPSWVTQHPTSTRSLLLALLCVVWVPTQTSAQESYPEVRALQPRMQSYPNLSPDGRFLVYASGTGFALNLYRLELATNEILQLTNNDFEDSAASWSPDGSAIIFQREDEQGNRDVWEVDADGEAERNLTQTPDIREQHPRYAPTGNGIVFDSNREERGESVGADGIQNYEIYHQSLDTNTLMRLTTWDRWDMYPSLSPNENHLAWRRALPSDNPDQQNFDIFVKDLTTGAEVNVTQNEATDTNPHWSPSGEWIVFASNRNGPFDLYMVRADGSGLRQLTNSGSRSIGYGRPSFSSDGTKVVANRFVRGVTDMVMLDVSGLVGSASN